CVGYLKPVLFKVVSGAPSINHQKVLGRFDRRYDTMPSITKIIYALTRSGKERPGLPRLTTLVGADDDEKWARCQRNKSLAAKGMPFHHFELVRQVIRTRSKDADNGESLCANRVNCSQRIIPHAFAVVDWKMIRPVRVDHLAKLGEGISAQRLGANDPF